MAMLEAIPKRRKKESYNAQKLAFKTGDVDKSPNGDTPTWEVWLEEKGRANYPDHKDLIGEILRNMKQNEIDKRMYSRE